jgi:hypothetical protein
VYVLTTELRLGNDTFPVPGNHAFALAHLFTLFGEAGLTPEQTFDARLSDRAENEPRDLLETKVHDPINNWFETVIVRESAGIMSVPATFILRPGPFQTVKVIGLKESVEWLEGKLATRNSVRYGDWVTVNPYGLNEGSHSPYCDLWAEPFSKPDSALVFATSYRHFNSDIIEFRVTVVTSAGRASHGELYIAVQSWSLTNLNDMIPIHPKCVQFNGAGVAAHHCFRIRCDGGRCYSVFGTCISGEIILSDVTVTIRRAATASA